MELLIFSESFIIVDMNLHKCVSYRQLKILMYVYGNST